MKDKTNIMSRPCYSYPLSRGRARLEAEDSDSDIFSWEEHQQDEHLEEAQEGGCDDQTPHDQMRKGLFSASRKPTRPADVKSFQSLHRPRIHGMAEWLLQYESVCRRQDFYLQQIRELRQQLHSKADHRTAAMRTGQVAHFKHSRLWRPSCIHSNAKQKPAPHRACVLHLKKPTDRRHYHGDITTMSSPREFLVAPRSMFDSSSQQTGGGRATLPPIGRQLSRNKTDYEPIENIAKRNKLNLNKYLGSSWARVSPRKTLDVSAVVIQPTALARK